MRALHDSIEIDAPPARLWDWLTRLAENYTDWHPGHLSAEWTAGEPNAVGSVLTAAEMLGRTREVLRFQLTSVRPPQALRYRMRGPISWLLPGGAFSIEPAGGGARFTATISYRFGRLTELLFRRRMLLLQHHMREEAENLKRIMESAS